MPLHRLYDTKEEAKEHIAGPSEPGGAIPPTLQILTGIKRKLYPSKLLISPIRIFRLSYCPAHWRRALLKRSSLEVVFSFAFLACYTFGLTVKALL